MMANNWNDCHNLYVIKSDVKNLYRTNQPSNELLYASS